jgi:hypothetical protein
MDRSNGFRTFVNAQNAIEQWRTENATGSDTNAVREHGAGVTVMASVRLSIIRDVTVTWRAFLGFPS